MTQDIPPPTSPTAPRALLGAGDVVLAAGMCGLLAGAAEVAVHFIRQRLLGYTLFLSPEYFWQLPLADLLLFGLAGGLLALLGAIWPALREPRLVRGVLASLFAFALLLLTERIHVLAELLLAAAFGVTVARLFTRREAGPRKVRVAAAVGVLLLVLIAAGQRVARAAAERRALAALPAAAPGRPNILLIILDTVRAWNLGLYGYPRPTTPKLREWVAQGTTFERALAPAPWTTLSHAVFFTGRHPSEVSVRWDRPLDSRFPTLAEALRDAGYATAGFVANYTQAGRPTGLARGFVRYEDYPATLISMLRRTALLRRIAGSERAGALLGRRRILDHKPGSRVSAEFLRWEAGQRGGRPWFAFLNYLDAHGPYLPPVPYDTMYAGSDGKAVAGYWERMQRAYGAPPLPPAILREMLDAYDGALTYLDSELDALLRELLRRGALANTIVLITSDHGELFGEHGVIAHGNNLYLPVLYVPLVVMAPGRVPAGARIPAPAALRDLPATLLDLAAVPNPGLPGRSLAGHWRGSPLPRADTLFALVEYNRRLPRFPPSPVLRGNLWSVVLDSLHYIRNGDGAEELYHMGQDSWEVRNLAGEPAFRAELERHRAALRAMPGRRER